MDDEDRQKASARLQLVLDLMKNGWPRHVPASILTFAASVPYGDAPLAEAEVELVEGCEFGWDTPVWEPRSLDGDVDDLTELARVENPGWTEEMIRRQGREEGERFHAEHEAEVRQFRRTCDRLGVAEPKDMRDAYAFVKRIGLLVEYDREGEPGLKLRADLNVLDALPLADDEARHEQYRQWFSKYREDLRAVFRLFDPIGVRHTETTMSVRRLAELMELSPNSTREALHGFLCHGVVTASREIDEISNDDLFQMRINWEKVDEEYRELNR